MISEAENRLFDFGTGPKLPLKQEPQVLQQRNSFSSPLDDSRVSETTKQKLRKINTLAGAEFAPRTKRDSLGMLSREQETNLFTQTIAELSKPTDTPENQIADVLNTLIDAGSYEDFKPRFLGIFLNLFGKKFDSVRDRIKKIKSEEDQIKSAVQQIKGEKDDVQLELTTLRQEMQEALDQNFELTQANIELEGVLTVFKETQQSETRLRDLLNQAQYQMADLRAALFSSQQSEKEYADNMKDYQEQVSELRIEL